jgi:EmrB/QacA subfamily drug resistance transporter
MTPSTEHSHRQVMLTFAGLLLAMLLASLDQTIVSTALPTIVGDLGGLDQLSWLVAAYILAATVSMPIWGRVSDLYGRKRLFQAAIVVFLAGSAASGAAQSLGELITFRALQGLGAGGLMTLAMAIVGEIISPRERGRYQGYIQMVFVVASVAGPLLGGLFADHLSWRWVFYVNLPIGAVALAVISATLTHQPTERRPRIDYLGAALLAGSISSILLVTTWGGQQYAWGSPEVVALSVGAVALLGTFLIQERRTTEPILPLRLFRDPVFGVVSAVVALTTCAFFAAVVFVPLFLQAVTGASATQSGLLLLPMLLAATTSTAVAGRLMSKTGRYKAFPVIGLSMMTIGLLLLSRLGASSSQATVAAFSALFGLGFGMVSQILMVAIQNSVDRRDLGIATASANLFRALGGSVGVAVFGAVLTGRLGGDSAAATSLPPTVSQGLAESIAHALQGVFLVAAPIAALGLVVVLFLREVPLRGNEEANADRGPQPKRGGSDARGQQAAHAARA